jgi:hypothetical protein
VRSRTANCQPIYPDVLYPLSTFKRISGIQDKGLREARAAGLRIVRKHGRAMILGSDFICYWMSEEKGSEGQSHSMEQRPEDGRHLHEDIRK